MRTLTPDLTSKRILIMTTNLVTTLARALVVAGICCASVTADAARVRCNLDIDGNGEVDALTDGLLLARAAHGMRGFDLVRDALGAGAMRTNPDEILDFIVANQSTYDIDGDGVFDGSTDAVLLLRHMFGLSGERLVAGAVAADAPRRN